MWAHDRLYEWNSSANETSPAQLLLKHSNDCTVHTYASQLLLLSLKRDDFHKPCHFKSSFQNLCSVVLLFCVLHAEECPRWVCSASLACMVPSPDHNGNLRRATGSCGSLGSSLPARYRHIHTASPDHREVIKTIVIYENDLIQLMFKIYFTPVNKPLVTRSAQEHT
jgi:hypothetical protein